MSKKISRVMHLFYSRMMRWEWLWVFVLVGIGAVLRFWNFPNTLDWSNDSSRDMTVAYQIAHQGVRPLVGHYNTGTNGYYPPYYYYFLAGLSLLDSSPHAIYFVFVLAQILSLVGFYVMGKLTLGRKGGISLLLVAVLSQYLLYVAYGPKPAPWTFPGYILALTLFLGWLKHRQKTWLVVTSVGLLAVLMMTHSTNLALAGAILVWVFGWAIRHKALKTWLGLVSMFGIIVGELQLPFLSILGGGKGITITWSVLNLVAMLQMTLQEWLTNSVGIWCLIATLLALSIWILIKKGPTIIRKWRHMPEWWWFLVFYVVTFEVVLSLLPTGKLIHHQLYIFPCWLLITFGLIQRFEAVLSNFWHKQLFWWSMTGLLISSLLVTQISNIGSEGTYFKTQELFNQLQVLRLPLTTATVLVTDTDPTRLADASNSTEVWWFLITQLDRRDLKVNTWAFNSGNSQLILICDEDLSRWSSVTCQQQQEAVIQTQDEKYQLDRSFSLEAGYQVQLYHLGQSSNPMPSL